MLERYILISHEKNIEINIMERSLAKYIRQVIFDDMVLASNIYLDFNDMENTYSLYLTLADYIQQNTKKTLIKLIRKRIPIKFYYQAKQNVLTSTDSDAIKNLITLAKLKGF